MDKNTNRFVISDTHFGHTKCWESFKNADGTPLRPFSSTEEMDEAMVENWNAKVKPEDTVYHLGDVVIARRNLETVKRLNGRKILIRGNHDLFSDKDFLEAGFVSLRGCMVFSGKWIMTHIPIHPDSIARFRVNVHGHLHGNRVRKPYGVDARTGEVKYTDKIDPRYVSVCVEQIGYTPVHFDELEEMVQSQFNEHNYSPDKGAAFGNGSGPG